MNKKQLVDLVGAVATGLMVFYLAVPLPAGASPVSMEATPKSVANGLYMSGTWTATYGTSSMSINLPYIYNNDPYITTGSLRLSFWATTSYPARGQSFTGYHLSTFPLLSPLAPYYQYTNLSQSASMVPPPNGTYWTQLVLEEYDPASCGGYCMVDSLISATQKTFGPTSYTLSIGMGLSGHGVVVSTPPGINCGYPSGSQCSASFPVGTVVSLHPTGWNTGGAGAPGYVFNNWTGACTGGGECTVTMDANRTVNVFFFLVPSQPVNVFKLGSGSGVVTSSPTGVNCGATCSVMFPGTSSVQLTATPNPGSVFMGWGGRCSGTGSCHMTMHAAADVWATFSLAAPEPAVSQTVNANPGSVGKDVVFTMTARNNGAFAANGVIVYSAYDASATVIWVSPECSIAAPAIYACTVGTLPGGATIDFKLVLRRSSPGSVYNNAGLASQGLDLDTSNNTANLAVNVDAIAPGTPIVRYRLYSPVTLEHHFTTDLNEYLVLGSFIGTWIQEGTVGKVLNNPGSFNGVAARPYYRLYNTGNQQHHWTSDANEYYTLMRFPGWNAEGVDGYILPTPTTGTVQLYRLNYPYVAGLHHWTIDPNEYTTLINTYGWIGEGGSGFVVQ